MKRFTPVVAALALLLFAGEALAQGGIGASYERRDDQPREGIGLRLEKTFGTASDIVNVGVVGHTSFFSNTLTLRSGENGSGVIFSDTELSTYDFGAALKLAFNAPLVTPYIMGGVGFENYKIRLNSTFDGLDFPKDESTTVLNGTVGIQIRLGSAIRPFAEMRFSQNTKDYKFEDTFRDLKASKNRIALGVQLQF
jgi:opacity protein-like surface antigen